MTSARFSEEQLRPILGYIGLVRDELRMQNWDVVLHRTATERDDVWAHTWQSREHYTTNIELGPFFFDQSEEEVRSTVVHELIHAAHRNVSDVLEERILSNPSLPVRESNNLHEEHSLQMERFVSWITRNLEDSVSRYSKSAKYKVRPGCSLAPEKS